MSWSISDLFPPWGDSGERPPDNFQYDGGDQVNEKHLDYLWTQVGALENDVRDALDDIDDDKDGTVDEADSSLTYKGNDIDSDGDGTVDESDSALTYKGNDIDSDGDGVVDAANSATDANNVTATYKGNDIDSDGDGIVNNSNELEGNDTAAVRNHAPNSHASSHFDGGGDEIDAADLAGASGNAGQVLTSDGSAASWGSSSVSGPWYGRGSDGSQTYSSNTTINGTFQFTDMTIEAGTTVSVNNWVFIAATNSITINGTLEADGQGASGGSGGDGNASNNIISAGDSGSNGTILPLQNGGAGGTDADAGNGGDGGSGDTSTVTYMDELPFDATVIHDLDGVQTCGAGGGGGGGGVVDTNLTKRNGSDGSAPGGGGSGGVSDESNDAADATDGGDGGDGGGLIILMAPDITIDGTVSAQGTNGASSNDVGGGDQGATGGGGGGGSGGLVLGFATTKSVTGTIDVSAGSGAGSGNDGFVSTESEGGNGASGATGIGEIITT